MVVHYTDRQTERQTDRDRELEGETHIHRDKQTETETDTQRDRQTDTQRERRSGKYFKHAGAATLLPDLAFPSVWYFNDRGRQLC